MTSPEPTQHRPPLAAVEQCHQGPTNNLLGRLEAAHAAARMVGWDFSRLAGELIADDPWWDYESDCLQVLRATRFGALDLGTGGGERLSALLELLSAESAHLPRVIATEGWPPNVPVARALLAARGVEVLEYDSDSGEPVDLPDQSLDLVMARHESYDAAEVARVLVPGGKFLTQQVDGFDAPEIHEWFGGDFLHPDVTAEIQVQALKDAGMRIDQVDEWVGSMRFSDATALVTYIGLVPWDAPGFTVQAHAQRLLELNASTPIIVTQRRFRVYATKE